MRREAPDMTDQAILRYLEYHGRAPAEQIGEEVGLSAAQVRRRIRRLEKERVILRYTVVVDHGRIRQPVQAFVELKVSAPDVRSVLDKLLERREVREASTIAGDSDALVRLRVESTEHLNQVIHEIRETPGVAGTKTILALDRRRQVAEALSEQASRKTRRRRASHNGPG